MKDLLFSPAFGLMSAIASPARVLPHQEAANLDPAEKPNPSTCLPDISFNDKSYTTCALRVFQARNKKKKHMCKGLSGIMLRYFLELSKNQ